VSSTLLKITFLSAVLTSCTDAVHPVVVDSYVHTKPAPITTSVAVTPRALPPDADAERLKKDVAALAVPREPFTLGWEQDRNACESRLRDLGYDVKEQKFVSYPPDQQINVLAEKPGQTKPTEKIILSAHYDHVYDCPGADDDASGLAAVFEIARLLEKRQFARTLVIACWDLEEDGLLGSTFYAKNARENHDDIRLAVALDAVGFVDRRPNSQQLPTGLPTVAPGLAHKLEQRQFKADFIAMVHDPDSSGFTPSFEKAADAIDLPLGDLEVSHLEQLVLNDVLRADHASFWLQGYPAVLLSDSGEFRNPAYHCYNTIESPDTLDYGFLAKVTSATAAMVADALDGKEQRTD
jgi:hypothetical protein